MGFYATYVVSSAVIAGFIGLGAFVSVVVLSRRNREFLTTTYRGWLAFAALLCLLAPLGFMWGASGNISLSDAYLLQNRQYFHGGWSRALTAYSMFAGLVLGGLVAAMPSNNRSRGP